VYSRHQKTKKKVEDCTPSNNDQESDPNPEEHKIDTGRTSLEPETCEPESEDKIYEPPIDLDIGIALRKGIKSCTRYPIAKFVSYEKLSPNFHAFSTELDNVQIPKNIYEALKEPK